MSCYISSVACVLTWSSAELRATSADPLLASAVNNLRARMKEKLMAAVPFHLRSNLPELYADTLAACAVIDLAKVSVGGKHHLRVAVNAEIDHRARELRR